MTKIQNQLNEIIENQKKQLKEMGKITKLLNKTNGNIQVIWEVFDGPKKMIQHNEKIKQLNTKEQKLK